MTSKEKILEVARQTPSFAEAGRHLGISRERVRQIVAKCGERERLFPRAKYESSTEAAERLGYDVKWICALVRQEVMPATKFGGRWYIPRGRLVSRTCQVCGCPLPRRKVRYCTDKCRRKAVKE